MRRQTISLQAHASKVPLLFIVHALGILVKFYGKDISEVSMTFRIREDKRR